MREQSNDSGTLKRVLRPTTIRAHVDKKFFLILEETGIERSSVVVQGRANGNQALECVPTLSRNQGTQK